MPRRTRRPRPRLGCFGVGWIGCHRLARVVASRAGDVVGLADADPEALARAAEHAPEAARVASLEDLLALDLDGLLLATPSALHAEHCAAALAEGVAVFCQKPLARDAAETRAVVAAARAADRLLAVDFSYRHVAGMSEVRRLVGSGELGAVFSVELAFHNAYGPDKEWFYDRERSGGGCLIDLGIHLVDLALWVLDFPRVRGVDRACYAGGVPLDGARPARGSPETGQAPGPDAPPGPGGAAPGRAAVEDYAAARLEASGGAAIRLSCSWRLHAGRDAVIEARFFGTRGGACLRNVRGSFTDFVVERYRGTRREVLAAPPDAWGGRAAVAWARRLAESPRFDPGVERAVAVAEVLDWIYGRAGAGSARLH